MLYSGLCVKYRLKFDVIENIFLVKKLIAFYLLLGVL